MFLLRVRKPSVLFAFLEMQFMCVSHDRSEEMSIPSLWNLVSVSRKNSHFWQPHSLHFTVTMRIMK